MDSWRFEEPMKKRPAKKRPTKSPKKASSGKTRATRRRKHAPRQAAARPAPVRAQPSGSGGRKHPFGPDAAHLALLSGGDFAAVSGELLKASAIHGGLQVGDWHVAENTDAGDGGIDASVAKAPPRPSGLLPNGPAILQFKRSAISPGEAKLELRKDLCRNALTTGSAYRLVLGQELTQLKRKNLRAAIVKEARRLGCSDADVVDGTQLADWIAQFPSVCAHPALSAAGVPAFHRLQPFSEWNARHRDAFVSDDARQGFLAQYNDLPSQPGGVLHITGLAGAGKTRLALELVRQSGRETLAAYLPGFDNVVLDLLRGGAAVAAQSMLLVVDECSDEQRRIVTETRMPGSSVTIITIDSIEEGRLGVSNPGTIVLPSLSDDASRAMAARIVTDVDLANAVADRSGGYPKLISLLAEVAAVDEEAAKTIRAGENSKVSHLLGRFLGSASSDDAVRAVSLPLFLGARGSVAFEREVLAHAAELDLGKVNKAMTTLRAKELFGERGDFFHVSPTLLAEWLALDLWEEQGADLLKRLIAKPPEGTPQSSRLVQDVLRRLSLLCNDARATAVTQQILDSGALLAEAADLQSEDRTAFVREMAAARPGDVAVLLRRFLRGLPSEQLKEIAGRARRNLVWTLERCAWAAEGFEVAAPLLLQLSGAENESYANNATGVFLGLFGPMLGRTEATGEIREVFLKGVEK